MQTFLPYRSFARSARALDDRRLGKQRVETLQILNTLTGKSKGWRHHPAVKMWRGHEDMLILYGLIVSREWRRRGHNDTCFDKIGSFAAGRKIVRSRPPWLGEPIVHRSHQSVLTRKDPAHYLPLFGEVDWSLPCIWPVFIEEQECPKDTSSTASLET